MYLIESLRNFIQNEELDYLYTILQYFGSNPQ